jgi:hypothetical protein
MGTRKSTIIAMMVFVCSCSGLNADYGSRKISKILSDTSDECFRDVRDRKMPYATSQNCIALSEISGSFIHSVSEYTSVPGRTTDLVYADPDFKKAQLTAWMAVALSNAHFRDIPPVTAIW